MVTGVWRYQLFPVGGKLPPREGALIRHEIQGSLGYADLHPWPELGDEPLDTQLQVLKGNGTNLTQVNRVAAFADSLNRSKGTQTFTPKMASPSHASLPYLLRDGDEVNRFTFHLQELEPFGFTLLKLKLNPGNEAEISNLLAFLPLAIGAGYRIRLDLNAKSSLDQVFRLLRLLQSAISSNLEWLDWIEDPCAWNVDEWKAIREAFDVRLALDLAAPFAIARKQEGFYQAVNILVVKPATMEVYTLGDLGPISVAFTSYLDHPLGQLWAALIAGETAMYKEIESGGLCSHLAYEPNEFSERLRIQDGKLLPVNGPGFGYEDLLENLPWEDL